MWVTNGNVTKGIAIFLLPLALVNAGYAQQSVSSSSQMGISWSDVREVHRLSEHPEYGQDLPTLSTSATGALDQIPSGNHPANSLQGSTSSTAGRFYGVARSQSQITEIQGGDYGFSAYDSVGAFSLTGAAPGLFRFIRNSDLPDAASIPATFSGSYTLSVSTIAKVSTTGRRQSAYAEAEVKWSATLPWANINPSGYRRITKGVGGGYTEVRTGFYDESTESLVDVTYPFTDAPVDAPFAGPNVEVQASTNSTFAGRDSPDGSFETAKVFASIGVSISNITFPTNSEGVPLYKLVWSNSSESPSFPDAPPQLPFAPGDYDLDGHVDGQDLLAWQQQLGQTGSLFADGSGNGIVDAEDLALWQEHFGDIASTAPASIAIPEPSPLLTLITCFMTFSQIRRSGPPLPKD